MSSCLNISSHMRSSRLVLQFLLPTAPGCSVSSTHKPLSGAAAKVHSVGESVFCCVGVVKKPQVRFNAMDPSWQCTLSISQFGLTQDCEQDLLSYSQEQFNVVCAGELWYRYCRSSVRQDSVVHVQARAIQRPRYKTLYGTYVYETELQITPQFGSLFVIRNYWRPSFYDLRALCRKRMIRFVSTVFLQL